MNSRVAITFSSCRPCMEASSRPPDVAGPFPRCHLLDAWIWSLWLSKSTTFAKCSENRSHRSDLRVLVESMPRNHSPRDFCLRSRGVSILGIGVFSLTSILPQSLPPASQNSLGFHIVQPIGFHRLMPDIDSETIFGDLAGPTIGMSKTTTSHLRATGLLHWSETRTKCRRKSWGPRANENIDDFLFLPHRLFLRVGLVLQRDGEWNLKIDHPEAEKSVCG